MKCIVPLARGGGYDKSANNVPYLISVAGKPLLGHLVDQLSELKPEEVVFILGDEDRGLIDYITSHYDFQSRFIMQKRSRGSAHAILGAKEYVRGEVAILFGDTFFKADLSGLSETDADGIIWTSKVKDPSLLGVVFQDGEYASKLIEKPDSLISNLAMIGMYYFKDASKLFSAIEYLLEHKIMTKGSFTLTDAVQLMIDDKKKVAVRIADEWIDADHGDGLFMLNRRLLEARGRSLGKTYGSVIIKPVHIDKGAIIRNSIIGPNVSIGVGTEVEGCIIKESVVCTGARLTDAALAKSVIATGAKVQGKLRGVSLDANASFLFH